MIGALQSLKLLEYINVTPYKDFRAGAIKLA